MAFVSLNQKEFQRLLSTCNQVSLKNSDVEVFTYTKIKINKELIELNCFNSTLFFRTSLSPVNLDIGQDEVEFLIKTDLLANSVNLIKDEIISLTIDLDKTTLTLQSSNSKHVLRINLDQIDNFVVPEQKQENIITKLTVNSNTLLNANKLGQIAVGNPRSVYQPEFLNICYTLLLDSKQVAVVSTDRYRMIKAVIDIEVNQIEDTKLKQKNYLLNPKNLNILNSLVDQELPVELIFETDSLWVEYQQSTIVVRYGEGVYPDYDKILPQSFACSFIVNTKEVLESLKQVFYFARMNTNNKSMTVQVDPAKKQLTFSASTGDGYSSESSVGMLEYDGSQESWSQSFNAEYLIDYINVVSVDRILWESNPSKPSVLSPENGKDKQLYLVSGLK